MARKYREFKITDSGLPDLSVRYFNAVHLQEIESSIRWMTDDFVPLGYDSDQKLRLLGVDTETGADSIRLLQIATKHRCLLFRLPAKRGSDEDNALERFNIRCNVNAALKALLEDRTILKSGAELWGDALDIFRDLGICMNGCLDVSTTHRTSEYTMSLEKMVHEAMGNRLFRKDKTMTRSRWDEHHSDAQMRYGALDAQASYLIGVNEETRPLPFHLSDMCAELLKRCSVWVIQRKQQQREKEETEMKVAFSNVEFTQENIIVHMSQYGTRIRDGSTVSVVYKDGECQECHVMGVTGKQATLETSTHNIGRTMRDIEHILLSRENELDLEGPATENLIREFILSGKPFTANRFLPQLTGLPFRAEGGDSDSETKGEKRERERDSSDGERKTKGERGGGGDNNTGSSSEEDDDDATDSDDIEIGVEKLPQCELPREKLMNNLNESQVSAIDACLSNPITVVRGPPGTGKTKTISYLVKEIVERSPEQRILCVAQTNTAARHLAEAIRRFLTNLELGLSVSEEYFVEWHEGHYTELRKNHYVLLRNESDRFDNPQVLVTTVGSAVLSTHYSIRGRQTVIVDEASQVSDLMAVLLLNGGRRDGVHRLCLFGDDKQLGPYISRNTECPLSAMDAYLRGLPSSVPYIPAHSCLLNRQYRMPKHLGDMSSQTFYDGKVLSPPEEEEESKDGGVAAAVEWVDVMDEPTKEGKSLSNSAEGRQILRILENRIPPDSEAKEGCIAIICFYEGQRKYLRRQYERLDKLVFTVDSFQGQEADYVILSLTTQNSGRFIKDRRRVNVACSRAKKKLFIVGNKVLARDDSSPWKPINEYLLRTREGWHVPIKHVPKGSLNPISSKPRTEVESVPKSQSQSHSQQSIDTAGSTRTTHASPAGVTNSQTHTHMHTTSGEGQRVSTTTQMNSNFPQLSKIIPAPNRPPPPAPRTDWAKKPYWENPPAVVEEDGKGKTAAAPLAKPTRVKQASCSTSGELAAAAAAAAETQLMLKFKTVLCNDFEKGTCKLKGKCPRAHGSTQLKEERARLKRFQSEQKQSSPPAPAPAPAPAKPSAANKQKQKPAPTKQETADLPKPKSTKPKQGTVLPNQSVPKPNKPSAKSAPPKQLQPAPPKSNSKTAPPQMLQTKVQPKPTCNNKPKPVAGVPKLVVVKAKATGTGKREFKPVPLKTLKLQQTLKHQTLFQALEEEKEDAPPDLPQDDEKLDPDIPKRKLNRKAEPRKGRIVEEMTSVEEMTLEELTSIADEECKQDKSTHHRECDGECDGECGECDECDDGECDGECDEGDNDDKEDDKKDEIRPSPFTPEVRRNLRTKVVENANENLKRNSLSTGWQHSHYVLRYEGWMKAEKMYPVEVAAFLHDYLARDIAVPTKENGNRIQEDIRKFTTFIDFYAGVFSSIGLRFQAVKN